MAAREEIDQLMMLAGKIAHGGVAAYPAEVDKLLRRLERLAAELDALRAFEAAYREHEAEGGSFSPAMEAALAALDKVRAGNG